MKKSVSARYSGGSTKLVYLPKETVGKVVTENNVKGFKCPKSRAPVVPKKKRAPAPCSTPSRETGPPSKKVAPVVRKVVVDESAIKRAGNFLLGPKQGGSPVKCIDQFLARKDGTDEFYVLKILTQKSGKEKETMDDRQGKTLLHTEHSLLSLLKNVEGVTHEHGMFRETVQEKVTNEKGKTETREVRRLCLVLDCYVAHDFSPKYTKITSMQTYVIKHKHLPESEAIRIFYKVVQIVERLHQLNIVHRDLKLGNIIYNKDDQEITLANFCLGKHLSRDNDLLKDQRGSPAYISPDVISGKPYLGKPSDMWSLGIILYTMLYGQFPFYDQSPPELFRKIKLGEYPIPDYVNVSAKTVALIKSLLVQDPNKRITASQALEMARSIVVEEQSFMSDTNIQVVPDCHPGAERPKKRCYSAVRPKHDFAIEVMNILEKYYESSEVDEAEPERKKAKLGMSSKISELFDQYTLNEEQLQRIHVAYVARKISEAAGLGTIPFQMVAEKFAHQISTLSNDSSKSADTNNDSALVPDIDL